MPEISVILDNYNYANFLPQAITSVLDQSFKDYELIIVDDGSTDNSREIIEKFASQYSGIIPVYKKNGGQTSAFNTGFSVANGNIIALLDSDDFWYPNKLDSIAMAHKTHKIIQHYLSRNGNGIYRKIDSKVDWRNALTKYGYMYQHCPTSGLSFDRETIAPFFPLVDVEDMRICADGCILMLAMTRSPVFVLEDVLGYYRIHDNNLHAQRLDTGINSREVLQRQRDYVNKQLKFRGFTDIPFDNHAYLDYLLKECQKEEMLKDDDIIAIYGTESSGLFMTDCVNKLNINIWGYADSNPAKHGISFCGKMIYSPEELTGRKDEVTKIIIASSAKEAIQNTLHTLGFTDDRIISFPI